MLEQGDLDNPDPFFEPASLLRKTLSTEDPIREDLLLEHQERIDKLSQRNRVINFCTDAGSLTTVDVGRDEKSTNPKGRIRGSQPVTCWVNTEWNQN